ncbi:nuclear transport factor 2 family protein [Saccharopolyspora sp. NPDC000359]|uniref:nuclear transport factor 2 family protein n=1 Tax=Saccharopolyspora sp. NPDC000359 TaxID=3154251 RepID=UPI00331AB7FF
MDWERALAWVAGYERAWRTPGVEVLAELFTPDATYQQAPYLAPVVGLPAIERMWQAERTGPDEQFQMSSSPVALEGDTAVVRVEVHYGGPGGQEYRDLWVIGFAPDGRCRAFEEWPFWPGKGATPS